MIRWMIALAVTLLTCVGCQEAPPVGGKNRPKAYTSAVSLSPSTTELIASYFINLQLVGRTAACNYPDQIKTAPVMGSVKPDFEKIVAAKPSVVFVDKSLYGDAEIQKLKDLKLDVIVMDVKTVKEFCTFLQLTAGKVGSEMDVNNSVDKIVNAYENASSQPGEKRKIMILLGDTNSEYMVAGLKTFQADLMRGTGYELVGPDAEKFQTMPVEQLIGLAPDVIITTGDPMTVFKDPRLQSMGAIKNRRIIKIDADSLLRAGSRVERILNDLRPAVEGLYKQ
jgi:iron complex transport system substrate-binding protein